MATSGVWEYIFAKTVADVLLYSNIHAEKVLSLLTWNSWISDAGLKLRFQIRKLSSNLVYKMPASKTQRNHSFFSEQNTSYFYGKNEHILLTLFHNKKYLQVSHTKKRIWVTYLSCRISYESDCFSSTILLKLLDWERWFSESDDRTCERMPTNKQHYFITCIKTESIRKLTNFNFQWTKTLYQNNLKNIAFFFTFFTG